MIIVSFTCNITLPRRRGSRPDGARYICNLKTCILLIQAFKQTLRLTIVIMKVISIVVVFTIANVLGKINRTEQKQKSSII